MIAENRPIFPEAGVMVAEPQQTGPQQREGEMMGTLRIPWRLRLQLQARAGSITIFFLVRAVPMPYE
jgi:hypothetical protein